MKASISIGELRALCELAWGERVVVLTFEPRRVRVRAAGMVSSDLFVADLDETDDDDDGVGQILAACAEKLSERAARAREMVDYYRSQAKSAEGAASHVEAKVAQIRALFAEASRAPEGDLTPAPTSG